jgi:hypothetical protein
MIFRIKGKTMTTEPMAVSADDIINFSCSDQCSCFNKCCMDVNQFLYPYDILRLRKHLSVTSSDFLKQYLMIYSGDATGLPIASLKTSHDNGHACPFVSPEGCTVYHNRPSSCRIFPLARAISRSRDTGKITEHFALIHDPVCQGFKSETRISVRNWVKNQEMTEYNRYNDMMIELISLKQQVMPGPLSEEHYQDFVLACYDIDTFRDQLLNKSIEAPEGLLNNHPDFIDADDGVLLEVSLTWLKNRLFGK